MVADMLIASSSIHCELVLDTSQWLSGVSGWTQSMMSFKKLAHLHYISGGTFNWGSNWSTAYHNKEHWRKANTLLPTPALTQTTQCHNKLINSRKRTSHLQTIMFVFFHQDLTAPLAAGRWLTTVGPFSLLLWCLSRYFSLSSEIRQRTTIKSL